MATTISTDSPKLTANIADHADVFGGRSLVFDGITDYLDLGTVNLDTSDFTISMWINFTSIGSYEDIFDNRKASTNGFIIRTSGGGGGIDVLIDAPSNLSITYNYTSTGQWLHLCVSVDRDGNMVLYANGKAEGTTDISALSSGTLNHDAGCRIGANEALTASFHGKMCDFKLFKGIAFSESQVQELYKKPESNPFNTTQYLERWYPMIEGNPESPQSIVYDHSEKKLGDDIIINGDYSNGTTGWSIGAGGSADTSSGALVYTYSGSGNNFVKQEGISAVNGALYKAVFTVTESGGSAYYGYWDGTNLSSSVINLDTGQKTYTQYFTATSTSITIRFVAGSSNGNSITVDNVSIKEVLMGRNATTNFFGDDLQTGTWNNNDPSSNGMQGFTGASADGFTAVNTVIGAGDNDASYGDEISFTAGKTYQLSFTNTINSGTMPSLFVGVTSGTAGSADNIMSYATISSTGDYSYTFTPSSTVTRRPSFRFVVNGTYNFTISNFSLKEVGVSSSGFETAVNEPVVPQVPLMRYNQKMIISSDASADTYVLFPGGLTLGLSEFTFSIWHRKNIGDSSILFSVDGGGSYIRFLSPTRMFAHMPAQTGSFTLDVAGITDDGNLHHYVFSISASSNKSKLYIDGVLKETDTNDGNYYNSSIRRIGNYAGIQSPSMHDEFSIFSTALTDAEVQELFNDGVALDATTHSKASALKAYLRNDGVTTWKNRADNFATFNGVNDVITRNAINVDYKSVSVWVRPSATITSASSGVDFMFFGNWTFGSCRLGQATGDFTNELITLTDNHGGGTKKTGWIPSSGETIPSDSWTHLAFVWDGSKYVIYYNGQPQTVVASSNGHAPLNTNKNIRIGTGGASSTSFFGGDITGVAFWSESLTNAQVLSVYNSGHNGNIASIQSSDLELYYTFNPNASTDADTNSSVQDRSGNNRDSTSVSGAIINKDGTVQGSPDSITIREGLNSNRDGLGFYFTNPSSNVLRLNGVDEYVVAPDTDLSLSEQITIECWAKNNSDDLATDEYFASHYETTSGNYRSWFFRMKPNEALRFVWSSNGTDYSAVETSSSVSNVNTWRHYVVTLASGVPKIYVDGESLTLDSIYNSNGLQTSIYNTIGNIFIGRIAANDNDYHWNGLIDEVKIYNRKLDLSEIQKNYKHQKGKHKND